jgi:peptidyl-prolyl cis-trans isomerase A (cyclophilin A)
MLSRATSAGGLLSVAAMAAACTPATMAEPRSSEPAQAASAPAGQDESSPGSQAEPEVWELEAEPVREETPRPWTPAKPVPLAEPLAKVPIAPGDPEQGQFTLDEATRGLPEKGQLFARLSTDHGEIVCELWPHRAPITVANFVGLARGLRPFKDPLNQTWVKRPAYDDTVFHRVIPGFMIQGGDPLRTGTGDGGYVIPDETWVGSAHDQPGLLCMATEGPNTGSMQFFVTDRTLQNDLSYLDGSYTVFGECLHTDVVESIASVKAYGDKPVSPPRLSKVEIYREVPNY